MPSPPPKSCAIFRSHPRTFAVAGAVFLFVATFALAGAVRTLVGASARRTPTASVSAVVASNAPPTKGTPPQDGASFHGARFVWPTPLKVSADTPWETFAQAAASGDPATGLFGLHRNSGSKFHEGLDIRPAARDRRGEPADVIRAALPGIIVHLVPNPNGPYGRYVVLWHAEPGLNYYTLYAHLGTVSPALTRGRRVEAGDALGVMGRSDAGRGFSKDRAHLHFEIGVQLNSNFGAWYARQKEFGSQNLQGAWNGINLVGLDPLPFIQQGLATGNAPRLLAQMRAEPAALTVYVATPRIPAFVRENPGLLTAPMPAALAGWKIEFAWHGVPLRWTPLTTVPAPENILSARAEGAAPDVFAFNTGHAVSGITAPAYLQLSSDSALVRKAVFRGMLEKTSSGSRAARKSPKPPATSPFAPGPACLRHLGILFE